MFLAGIPLMDGIPAESTPLKQNFCGMVAARSPGVYDQDGGRKEMCILSA